MSCTDLSLAGKQAGMAKGSGTRSGLLWEVERLLRECKELADKEPRYGLPDVLIMENVSEVRGYKNKAHFDDWVSFLDSLGYTSYADDLNAADYGVAQHRVRCFMVSILGDYNYRFPTQIPLNTVMADYLEDEVDEKFYIKSQKAYDLIVKLIDNGTLEDENALASKQASKQVCVDGTINEPGKREVANCISARTDRGISNHRSEGTCVLEQQKDSES